MPTKWLQGKLEQGELIDEEDIKRILKSFTGSTQAKRETNVLDFKERLLGTAEGRCKLTKSLVEFANSSGGVLLYGIADDGERVGCEEELLDRLDPAKIQDLVGKYVGDTELRIHTLGARWYKFYVAVIIYPSSVPIVFEKNGEYESLKPDGSREKRFVFYEGTIVVREGAKGVRAKQRHLNRLIQRSSVEHARKLVRRFEKVAYLPEDSELVAVTRGTARGAKLVSAETGIPVQITEDPERPALPVREILSGEPFERLDNEIMSQVRAYRTDDAHRIEAQVVTRWYLSRAGAEKLPQAAELAYVSAIRNYAFPMFWAAKMKRDRLRALIEHILAQPCWPDIMELPYTIGAFFWEERIHLFDQIMRIERYASVKRTTERIRGLDWDKFYYHARTQSKAVRIHGFDGGRHLHLETLFQDRNRSQQMFAELLSLFVENKLDANVKPVAKQLDTVLHAREPDGEIAT